MSTEIVRVSEKGQIVIPAGVRRKAGIRRGDRLLAMEEGGRILLLKADRLSGRVRGEFRTLLKHSEKVASKLWSTPADDVWDAL